MEPTSTVYLRPEYPSQTSEQDLSTKIINAAYKKYARHEGAECVDFVKKMVNDPEFEQDPVFHLIRLMTDRGGCD